MRLSESIEFSRFMQTTAQCIDYQKGLSIESSRFYGNGWFNLGHEEGAHLTVSLDIAVVYDALEVTEAAGMVSRPM